MHRQSHAGLRRAAQFLSVVFLAGVATGAPAQLPFFAGAEGFGGSFSGSAPAGGWFSNATVYHVTTTADDPGPDGKGAPGTLRGAFRENTTNKIIVFDVAGTFQLTVDNLDIKNLSNYYIAGQTAPGPVTVYGDMAQLTHSGGKENRNVILRYMSFRKGTGDNSDSITFAGSGLGTHLILDHVSASWSEDEILSVANNNTNVTVQYSAIHDALVNNHAYGSLIRPRISSQVTFHHNLYAHNASRQARFGTYNAERLTAEFVNNVIYNWRDRASYAGGSSESDQEYVDINYVGNYLIAGPGTQANASKAFIIDKNVDVRLYESDNFIDSDQQVNPGGVPNGSDIGWDEDCSAGTMCAFGSGTDQTFALMGSSLPFPTAPMGTPDAATSVHEVTRQPAIDAYHQVIDHVGNWWWQRDAIDSRVINNVLTNTGPTIGASAPPAAELNPLLSAPVVSHSVGYDVDNDGMKDEWEAKHGGDLIWNSDFDNDGYINLIEFINELGEFPAPTPIVFNGATNNRYAQITNWKTDDGGITAGSNWQPSKFDEARINSGTAAVDSVGQHAGLLKIATGPANVAALNVTAGWLDVNGSLVVGVEGTGTVSQSGGSVIAVEVLLGAESGATGVYNLSNGMLRTASLDQGDGDADFNLTGGILSADNVGFDFENMGGMIAPGNSIGESHFHSNLTLSTGTTEIELSSSTISDKLVVDGLATLGGDLIVELIDEFMLPETGSWEILTASGGIEGNFSSITDGFSVQKQGNSLLLKIGAAPVLAGDYNEDGVVDAADYTKWRDNVGQPAGTLPNDTDGGEIGPDQYDTWVANFGAAMESGSGELANSAVPEPASFALSICGCLALFWSRRH